MGDDATTHDATDADTATTTLRHARAASFSYAHAQTLTDLDGGTTYRRDLERGTAYLGEKLGGSGGSWLKSSPSSRAMLDPDPDYDMFDAVPDPDCVMPLHSVAEQEHVDDDDDDHAAVRADGQAGSSEGAEAEEVAGQGSRCLIFSGPRHRPLSGTTHLSIPSRMASSTDLGSRAARKVNFSADGICHSTLSPTLKCTHNSHHPTPMTHPPLSP